MPWQEFVLGFQIASDALDNPKLDGIPPVKPSHPQSKKTRDALLAVQRDPFLRVLAAVREHFGVDYQYLPSFVHRFWALIHLLRRGHIEQWITTNEENNFQAFHPAVLLAAAEVKLTNGAKFPIKRFITRVEEIVREEGGCAEGQT